MIQYFIFCSKEFKIFFINVIVFFFFKFLRFYIKSLLFNYDDCVTVLLLLSKIIMWENILMDLILFIIFTDFMSPV